MFDFSFGELALIGTVALVVLGPERLPKVARTVGEWVGKAQRYVSQVKSDINREIELAELKKLQEEALLFPGRKALWYRPSYGGAYGGAEVFRAPNPDFGAVFTYYLKESYQTKQA